MPKVQKNSMSISITIPLWLFKAIRELEKYYNSRSEIIRRALEDYLRDNYPNLLPNPKVKYPQIE